MASAYNMTLELLADSFTYSVESLINTGVITNTDVSVVLNHTEGGINTFYYHGDIEQLKKPWVREPHFITLVVTYGLFFVVGITGNSLVIAVLCMGRAGSCVTFPCLVSMSWADILFLMVCVPHAVLTYFISHWSLSDFLCKLSGFVENLSANATVLNLILISLERYFVIAHPLSSKTLCTSKTSRLALAFTWVAAIFLACPTFVVMGTESNRFFNNTTSVDIVLCADVGVGTMDQKAYALWKLVSLFAIPTCIVLFCYIRVICILWLSTRQLQTMTSHTTRFGTARVEQNHRVSLRNGSPQSRLRSSPSMRAGEEALVARRQVIKMLIIIIVVFLVSWGPKLIVQVLKKFEVTFLYEQSAYDAFLVINCLPYFQSCINPLIYVLMSKNIRGSIRQLASTVCACCSRDRWAESPSHELIQTNHSLVGAGNHTFDTYPSYGTKSVSHV